VTERTNNGHPLWSAAEDAELYRLVVVEHRTYAQAGAALGRTRDACRVRFAARFPKRNAKYSRRWTPQLVALVDRAIDAGVSNERLGALLDIAPRSVGYCFARAQRLHGGANA
jgi:hypothetical protein